MYWVNVDSWRVQVYWQSELLQMLKLNGAILIGRGKIVVGNLTCLYISNTVWAILIGRGYKFVGNDLL